MTIESLKQDLDSAYEGGFYDDDTGPISVKPISKSEFDYAGLDIVIDREPFHWHKEKPTTIAMPFIEGTFSVFIVSNHVMPGDFVDVISYVTKEIKTYRVKKVIDQRGKGFEAIVDKIAGE